MDSVSWDEQYYAINRKTGALDGAHFGGLPDSAADVIWKEMIICRTNRSLCGLDLNTGEKLWAFRDPRESRGKTVMNATPSNFGVYTFVSTSIDQDGAALVATLHCVDNTKGEELFWHYTGAGGWTGSSCTPQTVICGSSTAAFMTCPELEPNPDGSLRILWRTKISGIFEEMIPVSSGNMAYPHCSDGSLYAFR